MRELFQSVFRFSWALSLLGFKQLVNMFSSRNMNMAPASTAVDSAPGPLLPDPTSVVQAADGPSSYFKAQPAIPAGASPVNNQGQSGSPSSSGSRDVTRPNSSR